MALVTITPAILRKIAVILCSMGMVAAGILFSDADISVLGWFGIGGIGLGCFVFGLICGPSFKSDQSIAAETGLVRYTEQLEQAHVEMHLMQQASDASSMAKSRFLAQMSHDLRTLLNGITGMTELLLNSSLNDRQERYAERIYYSGEMLLSLINDVLDISKIEAGEMDLAPEITDFRVLADEIVQFFEAQLTNRPVTIHAKIDDSVPPYLLIDTHNIKRVMLNLISNAVKFTEEGSITIRAAYKHTSDKPSMLHCSVEDTGIGLPADKCEDIFAPYAQLESHIKPSIGGTGLGLMIAREIVTLFGGKISATSQEGEGTRFDWNMLATNVPEEVRDGHREALRGLFDYHVSLIDVTTLSVHGAALYLAQWGIKPTPYSSIAECLQVAVVPSSQPSFIIIDTDFEPLSADQFQTLRYHCHKHEKVCAILIVSSDEITSYAEDASIIVIEKPLVPDKLLQRMYQVAYPVSQEQPSLIAVEY